MHALTCDVDCPGTDCLCDCPCHLPASSNFGDTRSGKVNTEPKRKAPAANGGRLTSPTKER